MTVLDNAQALPSLSQDSLLQRILYRIRRSLNLQDILDAAATELQSFLGVDRVKIYQFHADGSGCVMAEHLRSERRLPSLLGLNFPADDIPPAARQLFVEARVRNVVDVASGQIGQSQLRDPDTGELLSGELIWRPLDPCHAEYLTTMGVRSSVVAPILYQEQLWGLIVSHHSEPMEIQQEQLQGIQLLVEQLSVAIAQSALLSQAQKKATSEATINRIAKQLDSLSEIDLKGALEATVAAFQASGGRLLIQHVKEPTDDAGERCYRLYTTGTQPSMANPEHLAAIEESLVWQNHFKLGHYQPWNTPKPVANAPQPWAIQDLYQEAELRNLQFAFRPTPIRSILIVPLYTRQQIIGYLTLFRDELETETLWAGQFDPDARQLFPRQSFDIWRESKSGQAQEWTGDDLELAQILGSRFAAAIDQHELFHQVQTLNTNLEAQVQERTTQLTQTLQTLQQAQTQLIQNEKMTSLGQLVAGVAHEINNPINFIHGNLAHVSQYVEDVLLLLHQYQQHLPNLDEQSQVQARELDIEFIAEDLPKTIASMKLGTERICQIVQSLRNFSRLDQAEIKPVNIHEGIDSTLMILQHRLKAKPDQPEIEVIKAYGALPKVECYAGALNQVFMNLLSNAIDALEEKMDSRSPIENQADPCSICITTSISDASTIRISIADNGTGISDTAQKHLFDPFFTTKPIGKGTGLGLSISHQVITEKHQGTLECISQPGQGTQFIIEIPIQQPTRRPSS
jgi:light-regulated signal transduction histidine kinase (bacteriophytochrome)